MDGFKFYMPANTFFGRGCVAKNAGALAQLGNKALIVTGRNSAKQNGSQADVVAALEGNGQSWILFDEIEENPSVETVEKASKIAFEAKVDFIIGIGGGSPMDASKAIAVLVANPEASTDILFENGTVQNLPVVTLPTTAGTGSEVTQFSILTLHAKRTKAAIAPKLFANLSYLDPAYMDKLSATVTNNTAADALSHLIESYLSKNANFMSEKIVELGLGLFKDCMDDLMAKKYDAETRDKLMLASMLGGVAIAQTGTSIPHCLGYFLTYEKQIAHGRANSIVMQSYLELFPEGDQKVSRMLACLGFENIQELGDYLTAILDGRESFTMSEVEYYTERAFEMPEKLASFPYGVTKEDILGVYEKSLLS